MVRQIIHNGQYFRKICACWIPHMLTVEQKQTCVVMCQQNLVRFRREMNMFLERIKFVDESWVQDYTPFFKHQLLLW